MSAKDGMLLLGTLFVILIISSFVEEIKKEKEKAKQQKFELKLFLFAVILLFIIIQILSYQ